MYVAVYLFKYKPCSKLPSRIFILKNFDESSCFNPNRKLSSFTFEVFFKVFD